MIFNIRAQSNKVLRRLPSQCSIIVNNHKEQLKVLNYLHSLGFQWISGVNLIVKPVDKDSIKLWVYNDMNVSWSHPISKGSRLQRKWPQLDYKDVERLVNDI